MFKIDKKFINKINSFKKKYVHVIMIATKPDIIKQAPFYKELQNRWEQVLLIHTGQHYDFNLSWWMLGEFWLEVDLNLSIEWAYHSKIAQIISRLWDVFIEIKQLWKTPVPYIHWDTMTSMAAWCAAWSNMIWCVHVEAWIRTLWLKKKYYEDFINDKLSFEKYYNLHLNPKNYEWWQCEPYPEQYNTRCSEPASWIFISQATICKQNLINEGFRKDRIFVFWNSISDAMNSTKKDANKSKIFEKYPILEDWFVRFCIHRRENCQDKKRFTAIFEWMEKVIKSWKNVLLISLFATEQAINDFWLRKRIDELKAKYKWNFIYSEVWPYYQDVIVAMTKCKVCATDSGSMQEEMNILWVPTVTLRFWTDRPESCFVWWNIIAPPVSWKIIEKIVNNSWDNNNLNKIKNIYWTNVTKKSIDKILEILENWWEMFEMYKM